MEPFKRHTGVAVPFDRPDVDTDLIVPARYLKRVDRTGYGQLLFYSKRYLPDGAPDPEFVLNRPQYRGGSILVAGRNFGCGSSREHAVWALQESGFRAVIAPTMADIFRSNAIKNGLVPVELNADAVSRLLAAVQADAKTTITVDVAKRTVAAPGLNASFPLADFLQTQLLGGLDEIAVTLRHEPDIAAFELKRSEWLPRVR